MKISRRQGFCSGISKLEMTQLDFNRLILQGMLKIWVFDKNCIIQVPRNLDLEVAFRNETVY